MKAHPTPRRQPDPRYRTGGLVCAALYGPEFYRAMGKRSTAFNVYGDSPQARSLRAGDIRRKRVLSAEEWAALMTSREISFGLPPGTLTARLGPEAAPSGRKAMEASK